MDEMVLAHHGILGMKWGVRRYQNADGSLTEAGKKRYDKGEEPIKLGKPSQEKAVESSTKKSLRDMSDDELREQIQRLELEKRYKDLVKEPPTAKRGQKGRAFVSRILEKSGENIATQFVTYALGTGVNKAAKDLFGIKEEIVNPKKGQKEK